jgi:AraC-like DNA-binding protein
MTYYQEQVIEIRRNMYPKSYLYKQLKQAKEFIDRHFAEHIDLDDMAGEAFLSKFHFIRLFKSIYHQTLHQYLTAVRIEKARELLKTNTTVAEACFSVGFDSISSFKGLFNRYTSLTPSGYQKLRRQENTTASCPCLPFGFMLQKSNFRDPFKKGITDLCAIKH